MKLFLDIFIILFLNTFLVPAQSSKVQTSQFIPLIATKDSGPITKNIDIPPQFPGGQGMLNEFINTHLKHSSNLKNGIAGIVNVYFLIKSDGKITNVMHNGGAEDGGEAVRLVTSMPNWIPAKSKGINVPCEFQLPIRF